MKVSFLVKASALIALTSSFGAAMACGAFDSSDNDDDPANDASGGEGDGSTVDGADLDGGGNGESSSPIDDGGGGPPCDLSKQFGEAVRLTELDQANRSTAGARLTPDGKRIYYFHANPSNDTVDNFRIWTATRLDTTQSFTNPTKVNLHTAENDFDSHPTISSDGTTLFFQRALGGILPANNRNIFYATIENGVYAQPASVQGLATAGQERFPYAASDKSLWVTIEVSAKNRIARAEYQGTGTYGAPELVDLAMADAAAYEDSYAVVTSDLKRIYFTRTTGTSQNIFTASRPTPAGAFDDAVPVPELNTTDGEDPTWISPNGCEIYIQRVVATNAFAIFRATRPL